jgi:hypothetical protein
MKTKPTPKQLKPWYKKPSKCFRGKVSVVVTLGGRHLCSAHMWKTEE